jgi:hypothetical protein
MARIAGYRAFCYVQLSAAIHPARVSIERLARRIDVPTTFDVDDVPMESGLRVVFGTDKSPRVLAAALRTPFQTTPGDSHLIRQVRQHTKFPHSSRTTQ